MTAASFSLPQSAIDPSAILDICRTNVEALHHLKYLMSQEIEKPELLAKYLIVMEIHLQNMTDELCRKVSREHVVGGNEPFLMRERSEEEIADYDAGFRASSDGKELNEDETPAWRRGWAEAQE